MLSTQTAEATLADQATSAVREMLAAAGESAPVTFLDACLAIQVALQQLESTGIFCLDFSLAFKTNALEFTAITVSATRPATFDLSDLRKVIFMVCMPKGSPDDRCLLIVQRAVFEHLKDPTVQYKVRNETEANRNG